jgi:hypothetical protein
MKPSGFGNPLSAWTQKLKSSLIDYKNTFLHLERNNLSNPGATLQGVLFIAIEAGVLLGAAYMLTGRLWLSMGFHMAWNFTQAAIFPVHVSGSGTAQGLVKAAIAGPDLLTGGVFGMESSLVAFVLLTTTGVVLLVLAVRRGRIVPPSWKRAP